MILLDSTALSNFVLVGELQLLEVYCGDRGATTSHVFREFEKGVKEGFFINIELGWIRRLDFEGEKERQLFENLSKRLGVGEALSCYCYA